MRCLPRSIVIGGHEVKIRTRSRLPDQGQFVLDERTIYINSKYPPEMQWQTLFHETLHAALYLTGQSEDLSEAREEGLVLALEHALWPTLSLFATRGKTRG